MTSPDAVCCVGRCRWQWQWLSHPEDHSRRGVDEMEPSARNHIVSHCNNISISSDSNTTHTDISNSVGVRYGLSTDGGGVADRVRLCHTQQESRAVARKPRDAAAVLFGLKFVDNIHYRFKSSQASKARLHSSKHTGKKQNLTQNGHSRSLKVTCFEVSGKAIRD